jgi:muramidase (phage lysozyme)
LLTYKNSLVLCATAIVIARAFLTLESSESYYLLFSQIFEIAQQDTGFEVTFHYINESDIQSIVADGHRGQALGRLKNSRYRILT